MKEIYLNNYGQFLGKKSERLVVKEKGKIKREEPFFKINRVIITSKGISLSTDAIEECMKRGIQIDFLNFKNEPYAKLSSPFLQGTVKTRRAQLTAFDDKRGVSLAKAFVIGKVNNQVNLLKYMSKYRKKRNPEIYDYMCKRIEEIEKMINEISVIEDEKIDLIRQDIMTLEAHAAKKYWQTIAKILPEEVKFTGRETRGAVDLVNSMLNYGYAILYSHVQGAVILAGLDPFAGFMHVDRSGRASLVLDFVEEFRQQTVDKTIFAMINRGTNLEVKENRLTKKTKNKFRKKLKKKFDSYHQYEGKKEKIKNIIQMQARHIATHLRGEREYEPFVGSW